MEIPGYTITKLLGKGGMASVYLAVQDKFDREVALKVMAPSLSDDPTFRDRFLREAKIVAKISHPNIIAVYDVNEVNNVYYIAMEYHPGGDLKSRIRAGLTTQEAVNIIRDVAKALDYAHSKGYLHRDIKPDNILFRSDGSAVLTDFGIAKATEGDANLTQMGLVAGTPKYMSPEQARGMPLEPAADIYSLGVMFFETLTGRLPFDANDPIALGIMHLNSPIPKLEGVVAHFQPLIDRMMAKNPEERPQHGADVVDQLDELSATYDFSAEDDESAEQDEATAFRPALKPSHGTSTRPPIKKTPTSPKQPAKKAPVAPEPEPPKKSPALVIGLSVVLLAAAGAGYWFTQSGGSTPSSGGANALATADPVQAKLAAAAAAFDRGDLVTPEGKSAGDIYRELLKANPRNSQAQKGLAKVTAALQQQALASLGGGDTDAAEAHAAQLRKLAPEDASLGGLQKSIDAARSAAKSKDSADQKASRNAGRKDDSAAEKAPVIAETPAPAPVVVHQEPAPTPSPPPAPSHDDEDRQAALSEQADTFKRLQVSGLLHAAQHSLSDGDATTAAKRFRKVLEIDPENADAKDGLAKAQAAGAH